MQHVVIDKPYRFIPPRFSRFWHGLMRRLLPRHLRREFGVTEVQCFGSEKLRASIEAGHGVMIVSNHCRPCDPLVLDYLSKEVGQPFRVMASWHVFMSSWFQRFILPRVGAFSIYREGMDRESLKCAVSTLVQGKDSLVVFPEGIITRSNDRLVNFMEGPAFMARAAAKQRGRGGVVVHPVFIRYFFEGDLRRTLLPLVEEIEKRLVWQPQNQLSLRERILKIGGALLALKEMEYFQSPQPGTNKERLQGLVNHLLVPLEDRWLGARHDGDAMARVKRLRSAILPDMLGGTLTDEDRDTRWRHLADVYLVQQLHSYPGDYIESPTPERILETVERYEEDLTDAARPHSPIRATITVGDPIAVSGVRDRLQEADPVTTCIRRQLEELMESTKELRRIAPTGTEIS